MLQEEILELYRRFRLMSYRELFGRIREKDGSLSATEAFAADVIYLLGHPSLSHLAETLGVSQPNATYKVGNLIAKGYVEKTTAQDDKRECRLSVTGRFHSYFDTECRSLQEAVSHLSSLHSPDELESFRRVLHSLCAELSAEYS